MWGLGLRLSAKYTKQQDGGTSSDGQVDQTALLVVVWFESRGGNHPAVRECVLTGSFDARHALPLAACGRSELTIRLPDVVFRA
jgi:hypothetical protein